MIQSGFPNNRVGEHIQCSITAFYAVMERSLIPGWYPKRDRLGPFTTAEKADEVRARMEGYKLSTWRVERVEGGGGVMTLDEATTR